MTVHPTYTVRYMTSFVCQLRNLTASPCPRRNACPLVRTPSINVSESRLQLGAAFEQRAEWLRLMIMEATHYRSGVVKRRTKFTIIAPRSAMHRTVYGRAVSTPTCTQERANVQARSCRRRVRARPSQ